MNKIKLKNPGYLAPLFLALGLVGMFLYKWLFAYVEDPVSRLLPAFTVPEILLWVLTAGVCAAAFVLTQGTTFGRMGTSVPAVSDVLFAVGFVTQFLADVTGPAALVLIYRVSCVLAAVALLVMAFFTAKGKRPPFLTELFPCIACVVHLLICYQLWSEVPQLMDYVMGLGAVLCLSLGAYFRLADAAGLPGKPWNNAVGLMGVYFCTVAAFAGTFNLFFTAAAIWLAGTYAGITETEAK